MSFVLSPQDVLIHMHAVDGAVDVLDAVFGKCAQMTADELNAWTNFRNDWKAFAAQTQHQWGDHPTLNSAPVVAIFGTVPLALQQSQLQDDDGHIDGARNTLVGWHAKAKAKCGLDVPGPVPPPSDDPKTSFARTLEHIAVAGAVIVGGIVVLVGVAYVAKGVRAAKAIL